MADQFDVIVVGARCAGSPLAILLARAGLNVCIVDRARFPSDTASTHFVQPSGVKILDRLGVLEPLLNVTPAIERGTIAFDDDRVEVSGLTALVGAPGVSARRVTLDAILLEAAAAAGAEVRTQTAVTGLVEDRGRVAGVKTKSGELRAPSWSAPMGFAQPWLASLGPRSTTRRPRAGSSPGPASRFRTPDDGQMWLGAIGDHGFLPFPTDAGLFMAAVVPSIERRDEVLADREAVHAAELAHWPELAATLAGARRVGPTRLMSRDGFFRESAGPGWVLVGDAGHFKDPSPGQGISDAFDRPSSWRPRSRRLSAAQATPIGRCTIGGAGAIETPGRCTGSPTTWVLPARHHCSSRRSSAVSRPTPSSPTRCCASSTTTFRLRRCSPPASH